AGILDADPAGGVHRAVVIDERNERVVGLHVLADAAVWHDDDTAAGIIGTTLGRKDRPVDLHVRRHRRKGAGGRRRDGEAETIADEKWLGALRWLLRTR